MSTPSNTIITKLILGETEIRRLTLLSSHTFAEVISTIETVAHGAWYADHLATREHDHDGDCWIECTSASASPPLPPVSLFLESGVPLDSEEAWEKACRGAEDGKQLRITVVARGAYSIPPDTTQDARHRPSLSSPSSWRGEAFKKHPVATSTAAATAATATFGGGGGGSASTPFQLPCTSRSNHVLDAVADDLVNVMIKKFGTFDKRKPTTIPEKLAAAVRSVNMLKGALSHVVREDTDEKAAPQAAMARAPTKHLNPVLQHLSDSVQVYAELVQACLLDHVTEDEGAGVSDVLERRKLNKEVEGLVRAAAAAAAAAPAASSAA